LIADKIIPQALKGRDRWVSASAPLPTPCLN
jgi:hypothetical protein